MTDTTEYQCELCSEHVTLHEDDNPVCPVCKQETLEEV